MAAQVLYVSFGMTADEIAPILRVHVPEVYDAWRLLAVLVEENMGIAAEVRRCVLAADEVVASCDPVPWF